MVKKALILGSAITLWDDIDAALDLSEFDVVVAANEAGVAWSGILDAWVTLHPDEMAARIKRRQQRGYPDARVIVDHWQVEYKFKGQRQSGSSGLFAVKYALVDMAVDRAVCCGIPIEVESGRIDGKSSWPAAPVFKQGWEQSLPHLKDKVRSMSGWTSRLLGKPTAEWLQQSR